VLTAVTLLAERDAALRQLMAQALQNAGCQVSQCSNALQLQAELYSSPILTAERALLVLNAEISEQCFTEIAAMGLVRSSARAARADFVFVCEFGGLKHFTPPDLDEHSVLRILEKPFDLDELERLASNYIESARPLRGRVG
jgi:DNA-binding NtrC family response regulator